MLRRLLGGERRSTTIYSPSAYFAQLFGGQPTKAGVPVDETSALALPAVYACIRVLAESVASLPLVLYERDGRSRQPAERHPLYALVRDQANDEQTAFVWRELVMSHLAGWGNHYSLIRTNGFHRVMDLVPLHPMSIRPRWSGGRRVYDYTPPSGPVVTLPADEVLHVQGISYDGLAGWSPIRLHREAIAWGLATQEFSSQFFGNGAQVRGVLTHPGSVQDPDKLREQWEKAYGGENRQKVAVLSQGMEYKQVSISPDDAQFVETRQLQVPEICRIFNVPPVLVQDFSRATWGNAEHADLAFVKHTLVPWLTRIESALNTQLLSEFERAKYFFKFKVQGLLRGDNAGRAAFYQSGVINGWLTRNEVRELEDLDPIDGLDEPLTPVSAAQDGKPAEPAPTEPDDEDEAKQARAIALAAAARILAKEQRLLAGVPAADARAILERDLKAHVDVSLAAGTDGAERYFSARWRDLESGEPVESILKRWAAAGPAAILELIR